MRRTGVTVELVSLILLCPWPGVFCENRQDLSPLRNPKIKGKGNRVGTPPSNDTYGGRRWTQEHHRKGTQEPRVEKDRVYSVNITTDSTTHRVVLVVNLWVKVTSSFCNTIPFPFTNVRLPLRTSSQKGELGTLEWVGHNTNWDLPIIFPEGKLSENPLMTLICRHRCLHSSSDHEYWCCRFIFYEFILIVSQKPKVSCLGSSGSSWGLSRRSSSVNVRTS